MKKVLVGLVVLVVIAQFFRPEKNVGNPVDLEPFYAETKADEGIQSILKVSCNDCHSSHTNYPWYAEITPSNFFLAGHVNEGKEHLNFSDWNSYNAEKKEHKLDELVEMVKKSEMPLDSYTWIHQDAILSDEDLNRLVDWAKEAQKNYK